MKKITILLCLIAFTNTYAQQSTLIKKENMEQLLEQRKQNVQTYFQKIDNGQFDETYFNLYTEDVELYFPKFGFEKGKEGIKKLGNVIGNYLKNISHDIENFNYIVSDRFIVVEGTESGITKFGAKWPDYTISHGKFCNIFEFEGALIKRVHIYVDPDFTSEDLERIKIFKDEAIPSNTKINETSKIVNQFFDAVLYRENKREILDSIVDENIDWYIPGNEEKFSWLGHRRTKEEAIMFFEEHNILVKQNSFDIEFIAINGENAVAYGNLSSNIIKNNKKYESEFTAIIKVKNGKIVKYHFLEDSYKLHNTIE